MFAYLKRILLQEVKFYFWHTLLIFSVPSVSQLVLVNTFLYSSKYNKHHGLQTRTKEKKERKRTEAEYVLKDQVGW